MEFGGYCSRKNFYFLFRYWVTSHSITGLSPAELPMAGGLRAHLDLLYPDKSHNVIEKQDKLASVIRQFAVEVVCMQEISRALTSGFLSP